MPNGLCSVSQLVVEACEIEVRVGKPAVGLNRAKDVRRVMPLIKSRRAVDLERLRDEGVDLRSFQASA